MLYSGKRHWYLVVYSSRLSQLGIENVEEVPDGGVLSEDERHRKVLAKANGELHPGHLVPRKVFHFKKFGRPRPLFVYIQFITNQ